MKNYERLGELYYLLDDEYKKKPLNQKRVDEINHYLALETGVPAKKAGSFWAWFNRFALPENWKIYVTAAIGAFVAFNSQLHVVPQNVQDAFLAAAISLGFWAINSTQNLNLVKMKALVRKP